MPLRPPPWRPPAGSRALPDAEETSRILGAKRTRPPRRGPPPAGASLAPWVKSQEARFGSGPQALTLRWREIAGETLARRTEPVRLIRTRGGGGATLEVRVDGPAAALVQHQAPDMLARVNLLLGAGTVERLRIVQGPVRAAASAPAALTPAQAAKARRRVQPLDAGQEAELVQGLAKADEGPLRDVLAKLGRAVLRQGAR